MTTEEENVEITTDQYAGLEVTDHEIKLPEKLWIDALANPDGWVSWGLVGEPGSMKQLLLAYRVVGSRVQCSDGWEAVREGLLIKGFKR